MLEFHGHFFWLNQCWPNIEPMSDIVWTSAQSRGGFRGGGTKPRPPLFLLVKHFYSPIFALCQYLLKNQFMYRSRVSTVCGATVKIPILYSIIPTLRSIAMLPYAFDLPPPPPPPIKKILIWPCRVQVNVSPM